MPGHVEEYFSEALRLSGITDTNNFIAESDKHAEAEYQQWLEQQWRVAALARGFKNEVAIQRHIDQSRAAESKRAEKLGRVGWQLAYKQLLRAENDAEQQARKGRPADQTELQFFGIKQRATASQRKPKGRGGNPSVGGGVAPAAAAHSSAFKVPVPASEPDSRTPKPPPLNEKSPKSSVRDVTRTLSRRVSFAKDSFLLSDEADADGSASEMEDGLLAAERERQAVVLALSEQVAATLASSSDATTLPNAGSLADLNPGNAAERLPAHLQKLDSNGSVDLGWRADATAFQQEIAEARVKSTNGTLEAVTEGQAFVPTDAHHSSASSSASGGTQQSVKQILRADVGQERDKAASTRAADAVASARRKAERDRLQAAKLAAEQALEAHNKAVAARLEEETRLHQELLMEEELAREAAQHVEDLQRELARADAGSYDGAESFASASLSTPTESVTGNQPALNSRQTGDSTTPIEDGVSTTGRLFRRLLMPFQAQFRMATAVAQHAVGDASGGGGKEEAAPEARDTSDAVAAIKTRRHSVDTTKSGDVRGAVEKQAPLVDATKMDKQRRASEMPVSSVVASKGTDVKQVAEPKKAAKPVREEPADLPPLTEAALAQVAALKKRAEKAIASIASAAEEVEGMKSRLNMEIAATGASCEQQSMLAQQWEQFGSTASTGATAAERAELFNATACATAENEILSERLEDYSAFVDELTKMLDDLPVSQVATEVDARLELQAPLAHAAEARMAMKAMLRNGIKDANELAARVASQRKSGDAISPGRRTEDLQQERQELLVTVQKAAAAAAELQAMLATEAKRAEQLAAQISSWQTELPSNQDQVLQGSITLAAAESAVELVDALAKRIADAQQSVAVESDAASGRRTSLRVAVKKGAAAAATLQKLLNSENSSSSAADKPAAILEKVRASAAARLKLEAALDREEESTEYWGAKVERFVAATKAKAKAEKAGEKAAAANAGKPAAGVQPHKPALNRLTQQGIAIPGTRLVLVWPAWTSRLACGGMSKTK